jgi:hypothetical protein
MTEIENMERIGHAMMRAWGRIKKTRDRMWGEWMTIGEGLMEGRRWAMRQAGTNLPQGRGYVVAYAEWLRRYKVDDMDKSDRAKLLQLMEERPAIEEWRASLPASERHNLNNPTIAWRKWMAATREKKLKPRSASVSAAEHGRARTIIEELQARNAELEQEIAAAREIGRQAQSGGGRAMAGAVDEPHVEAREPGYVATFDEVRGDTIRAAKLAKSLSRDERIAIVDAVVSTLDLNIRDWVTYFELGSRTRQPSGKRRSKSSARNLGSAIADAVHDSVDKEA